MRITNTAIVLGVFLLLTACGRKAPPSNSTTSQAGPIAQPFLTAWQQGDKSTAISSFIKADWNGKPLFAADSVLNLSEDQFKALSAGDREEKSRELMAQLDSFKRIAAAVAQAGHDAAAKGDTNQARQYFASLKQCGAALDSTDRPRLAQLVGQALKKMADTELARIGQ